MRRRTFLAGFASTMLTGARAAKAQPASPVIGFLSTGSAVSYGAYVQAFRDGLATTGYVENQSVLFEYRWAENHVDRLSNFASELVNRRVDLIAATGGSPAALAAQAITKTIPIVFQIGVDPVEVGLVSSLSRPGGNVTGATMLATELGMKRWELLRASCQRYQLRFAREPHQRWCCLLRPQRRRRRSQGTNTTPRRSGHFGARLGACFLRPSTGACRGPPYPCRSAIQQQRRTSGCPDGSSSAARDLSVP